MKPGSLEHVIHNSALSGTAPLAVQEAAKVQDACRTVRSAPTACANVQHGTKNACAACIAKFIETHGREPIRTEIPADMTARLTRAATALQS
jgi:hypothetical protein